MDETPSGSVTAITCPLCEERIFVLGLGDRDGLEVTLRRGVDSPVARLYLRTECRLDDRKIHECGSSEWGEKEGLPNIYPLDPRPILPEAGRRSRLRITQMGAYLAGWSADREIAIPDGIARTVDDLLAQAMEFAQPSGE